MLDSGRQLVLTSISAREVILRYHTLSSVREEKDESGNIIKLTIDGYDVTSEEILYIKLLDKYIRPFKTLYITKSKRNNSYVLRSTELTKASRFIMPMLRLGNETQMSMKYNSNFINCYVGVEGEGYMDNIYLVYRYEGTKEYTSFEVNLKQHELYDSKADIDHQHVMYIFNMTYDNKKNFLKFKQGKYSKFTEDYKKKILSFIINPAIIKEADIEKTITYGVLNRTDTRLNELLKEIGDLSDTRNTKIPDFNKEGLELFSIPVEQEEIYTGDIEIPKSALDRAKTINELEEKKE